MQKVGKLTKQFGCLDGSVDCLFKSRHIKTTRGKKVWLEIVTNHRKLELP
jgi:hypothetical protein